MKTLVCLLFLNSSQQPEEQPLLPGIRDLLNIHKKMTLSRYVALVLTQVEYPNSGCLSGWAAEIALRHFMSFPHRSCCLFYGNQPQDKVN